MYKSFAEEEEMQPQSAGSRAGKPTPAEQPLLTPDQPLLRLQRTVGNQAVQRLLAPSPPGGGSRETLSPGLQPPHQDEPEASGELTHKIAASGTGKIDINYAPEAKDKSSKIVFIQVLQVLIDGKKEKPGKLGASLSFKDADTTPDFFYVDYLPAEKDPYYNGDDPEDAGGQQGDATASPKVEAKMDDTPAYGDGSFPAGKKNTVWKFRTAAFSAAGADKGTYYQFVDWTFTKEKGKSSKTAIGKSGTGSPGKNFTDAVDLWAKNHSFTLP